MDNEEIMERWRCFRNLLNEGNYYTIIHYLNLVDFIFVPRTVPSLFYNLPNTLSLIENAKNFQTPSS